jgi:hypothetical protein
LKSDSEGELEEIHVKVSTSEPRSLFCYDWFAVVTHQFQGFPSFFRTGESNLIFRDLPKGTKHDISANGIRIAMFCTGYLDSITSAFNMIKMFLGGITTYTWLPWFGTHVPHYME